jgi:hypothetical protein
MSSDKGLQSSGPARKDLDSRTLLSQRFSIVAATVETQRKLFDSCKLLETKDLASIVATVAEKNVEMSAMKQKTYDRMMNRCVRFKRDHVKDRTGTVVAPGKFHTWWLVEWPDGSRKLYPERDLLIISEPPQ